MIQTKKKQTKKKLTSLQRAKQKADMAGFNRGVELQSNTTEFWRQKNATNQAIAEGLQQHNNKLEAQVKSLQGIIQSIYTSASAASTLTK
jgi:hypothetical protein